MAELDVDYPRSDNVLERQLGRRPAGVQEERARRVEGTERVRHLLFGHLDRHADPE